jgi:hypothetical protein
MWTDDGAHIKDNMTLWTTDGELVQVVSADGVGGRVDTLTGSRSVVYTREEARKLRKRMPRRKAVPAGNEHEEKSNAEIRAIAATIAPGQVWVRDEPRQTFRISKVSAYVAVGTLTDSDGTISETHVFRNGLADGWRREPQKENAS